MAKVRNPLHSLSASGSIGGAVTFRTTAHGAVVTSKPQPYAQKSPAQLINQARMITARTAFGAISSTERGHWQTLATKYRRSAWASFFTEYQAQNIQAPNAPLIPDPQVYGGNITPRWF